MELHKLTGLEIGEKVNKLEVSAVEVLNYFYDRINKLNPDINAFVYTKYDEALEEAKKIDKIVKKGYYAGSFAGVPIGLKDFLPTKKGWTASHGGVKSFITTDKEDSIFYSTMKNMGAIAIGKTNAPSFGFRGTTYNKMYGNTCNPFNLGYNSGGSSGGSAAAVGARMVPIAECGDAGGSTRIPSAWCNCFGYKPSAGTVPSVCRPDAWTATHPYCNGGPASQSVSDAAAVVELMMGYNPYDPLSVPLPKKELLKLRSTWSRKLSNMRIAVTHDYNLFPAVDHQVIDAVDYVADALSYAGASVDYVRFDFEYSLEEMINAWLLSISIDDAGSPKVADLVHNHPEDLPEEFIYWYDRARGIQIDDYKKFHHIRTDILDGMLGVLGRYDVVLSPVSSCLPVLNAESNTSGPTEILGVPCEPLIGFGQTWLQNMTGNPAASVPAGLSREGLPIGVQVVGRRYFDEDVFTVAYAIEDQLPWKKYYKD